MIESLNPADVLGVHRVCPQKRLVHRLPGEQGGVFIASYALAEFAGGHVWPPEVWEEGFE